MKAIAFNDIKIGDEFFFRCEGHGSKYDHIRWFAAERRGNQLWATDLEGGLVGPFKDDTEYFLVGDTAEKIIDDCRASTDPYFGDHNISNAELVARIKALS